MTMNSEARKRASEADELARLVVVAEALPYTGAGRLEAQAFLDHLGDAGWEVVERD